MRRGVELFARRMESRLRANSHKGGWSQSDLLWLLGRLKQETKELEYCLTSRDSTAVDAMEEAADVGNFAMMIHDNLRRNKP